MTGPLKNTRHERYAQERAVGKPIGEAYVAAGFSANRGNSCRLDSIPEVKARVAELVAKAAGKAELTAERVLRELALIGFANMQDYMRAGPDGDPYLDFSGLTRDQAAALAEVTVEDFTDGRGEAARDVRRVKFKLADKRAALVDLGRHLKLFTDKVEHSGGVSISVTSEDAAL